MLSGFFYNCSGKYKIWIPGIFILILSGISCSKDEMGNEDNYPGMDVEIPDEFEINEQDITIENAVLISFSGDIATIKENPFSEKGVEISVEEGHVLIVSTITDTEVNYILTGTIPDGSVKIYSSYKFGLILNGISIVNPDGPAINIQSGKKATVHLVENTSNRLVDSKSYSYSGNEDQKATLFSEGQLIFEGYGSLWVYGCHRHAICSDDYIVVNSGIIHIPAAAKDGMHANDYMEINGGELVTSSLNEGIECEYGYIEINGGNIDISTSEEKGMGIKSATDLTIRDCDQLNISVSGNASKGLKSGGNILIEKGIITISTTGNAYYDTSDNDISSPACIKADGDVLIQGGTLVLSSTGSAGKGINATGQFTFNGANLSIGTHGSQYIYTNRTTSSAKAVKCKGNMEVNGGTIVIKTSSLGAEGLESKSTLVINDGAIEIEAYDDCINASRHIEINGGQSYCYSIANDGVDSNGTLTVTGGVVIASGTTSPEDGFDCDNNTFKITGGILIGTGGSTSTPTNNVCTQRSIIYRGSGTAGQLINIQSSAGKNILTYRLPRSYTQLTLLFSSPGIETGTYTINSGGNVSDDNDFYGYYEDTYYTYGNSLNTFTVSSMVTTVGSSAGGGGGGRPGGGRGLLP